MGTGLGLAISKRLLNAMEGDIAVESTYGKGSVFTFWLWQDIVDDTPLAVPEKYKDKYVLLLDNGIRGMSIKKILADIGVRYIYCNSEAEFANASFDGLTHVIYSDLFDDEILRQMRREQEQIHFIAIKNLRTALNQSGNNDEVLYEPVLLSKVADLLEGINDARAESKTELASNIEGVSFTDIRVLIVDDNEINLMVGGEMLRSYGFAVDEADSGMQAIAMCNDAKYDIIFMDHMMPEMDGLETTHQLRRSSSINHDTPIIALTANVMDGVKTQYLECGMNDFISKPIDVGQLHRTLIRWLAPEKVKIKKSSVASSSEGLDGNNDEFDLIVTLDDFGMYATDVMHEINGNQSLYINRLEHAKHILGGIVAELKNLVKQEEWEQFSLGMDKLRQLLFEIGARDCAGRSKNLTVAAEQGNIEYINMDFFSLMDNMYILEKKLEVLVPIAKGNEEELKVLNDLPYIKLLLLQTEKALKEQRIYEAKKHLERVFSISLDKGLDMQLLAVKKSMESGDNMHAIRVCNEILAKC